MIYAQYLKSLLLHKWYVFLAGRKTGVRLWTLIIHDWSKFLPREFLPYARHFFGDASKGEYEFGKAWLHHLQVNRHHPEHWILHSNGNTSYLPMPERDVREMVADWMGASKAYTGSWDMAEWIRNTMPERDEEMHPLTIDRTNAVLTDLGYMFTDYPWMCLYPGDE